MLMSIRDFSIYNHMGMPIIGIFVRVALTLRPFSATSVIFERVANNGTK